MLSPRAAAGFLVLATTAPPAGDILDMRLSIAVADLQQTTRAYRDVLGFTVEGETPFAGDAPTRALTGLTKADVINTLPLDKLKKDRRCG